LVASFFVVLGAVNVNGSVLLTSPSITVATQVGALFFRDVYYTQSDVFGTAVIVQVHPRIVFSIHKGLLLDASGEGREGGDDTPGYPEVCFATLFMQAIVKVDRNMADITQEFLLPCSVSR